MDGHHRPVQKVRACSGVRHREEALGSAWRDEREGELATSSVSDVGGEGDVLDAQRFGEW